MPSRLASLAVVVLVVTGAVAFVGPVAAADARLTLTDTAVAPATPTVGAPITATTTLRLSAGSNSSMSVDEVRVVDNDTDAVYGTETDLGTLSPGETLDVPVTFTVNASGSHDLQVVAVGTDTDGDDVEATRPLRVGVEPGQPQVELDTDEYVAGAETQVETTVSNPTTAAIRDITVSVTDPEQEVSAAVPTLAAGASTTVNLSVVVPESGNLTLELTTNYTTPNGVQLQSTTTRSVTAESLTTDVGVRAETAGADDTQQQAGQVAGLLGGGAGGSLQQQSDDGGSGESRIDVTVTNFGNAPVDDVVLTGEDSDGALLSSVGRFAVADTLAPGEEATVTVDLSNVRTSDDIHFVASYETPTGDNESALVYGYNARRGQATLTGVDVRLTESGNVTVDGNLANTGDGEVTSAVVAVEPTSGIEPAYPQRNYFVGTVDASAFAPFELTAQANLDNATDLTVRLTYTVDGEQVTDTVSVPLPPPSGSGGGGLSAGLGIGLTLALVAAGGVAIYLRRYREL
jgi:hypothetical protein